jgi:hypothetical protein
MPLQKVAVFSDDLKRSYRYTLWREWDQTNPRYVQFIGLNPSRADEEVGDATLSRCIGLAKRWGFGSLCLTNLFAFRATKPGLLKSTPDPVGPYNDLYLFQVSEEATMVVVMWGSNFKTWPPLVMRRRLILERLPEVSCIGFTRDGHPKHPIGSFSLAQPQPFPG